ncbi:hypothetical protein OJAV_G00170560 [Oryzias javanicus]|uniref:Vitellogenin domain-containing protein n=1 Tax=Oryzias javanicus TaxID=123683 RepID=A0A3S2MKT9_ORYJA|nr:hypothetical protein OJAV_G00170560 [Oryzias javanicus]
MAGSLLLVYSHVLLLFLIALVAGSVHMEPNPCNSNCTGFPTSDLAHHVGVSYTYRYRTTVATSLHGSSGGSNGLVLECEVDLFVVSKCHLMMQIRNSQIKRLSSQVEHPMLSLKSLRESLEKTRLKFSLWGGKVTNLCLQEGEQVWTLNIKRALLSMLQTSPTVIAFKVEKETDIYGECTSRYERRGPALHKTRDLKQCQQWRLDDFWPHSVTLSEDKPFQMELHCAQRHGETVMEEVNCTETLSMTSPMLTKTQTTSSLFLLRAQPGVPTITDHASVQTDMQFEKEGFLDLEETGTSVVQEVHQTARLLCRITSDLPRVSKEFLQLVFQLRRIAVSQMKTLKREASFKCQNAWQPLLDALPACGSESCIMLLSDLIRDKEVEEGQALSFLTTVALIPHPSPQIIDSITALMEIPELRPKVLLAASSLINQLCQKSRTSCRELPQVQTFVRMLQKMLSVHCEGDKISQIQERSVLLQLYSSSQDDSEVRIAAYQQLMLCPGPDVFDAVKTTLRSETSSQVGSFVWSHLTNLLRSEDPMKQTLIDTLPDDIISRDFEGEFLKYSSFTEQTFVSGLGIHNVETSLIFSPKSFLPRSASANLTMYVNGRAYNILEVDIHLDNAEPLLQNIFGDGAERKPAGAHEKHREGGNKRKTKESQGAGKDKCSSTTDSYLNRARSMVFVGKKTEENKPRCWGGVKVFGNEISVFTCDEIYRLVSQLTPSMAELAGKLLKGLDVQLRHMTPLLTETLVLPSLSGLPFELAMNLTSMFSLHLNGKLNYRDPSHYFLNGFIKPSFYSSLSATVGVHSVLGQAGLHWIAELRSSTSLDGSIQLEEGRDMRVVLNTPEDLMDIISLSSRVFQLSEGHREEINGSESHVCKTTCTPKSWSKIIGWQLCFNASSPPAATGLTFPLFRPAHLSLRLLKLDKGLQYYLLEAAYFLHHQKGSWLPRDASIHLLVATPQSSVPRDMSVDLVINPHRVLLRVTHPLKTIQIQGQLQHEKNIKSGKLEFRIDSFYYYIKGLVDTHTVLSEQRTHYYLEAKLSSDDHPVILSANVTQELGRKTSVSATVKNLLSEVASLSVAVERRWDSSTRQYSLEAELLFPGVVGCRLLGLMESKGGSWHSGLRLKYSVGADARLLHQECYTSQKLKSERDANLTYIMRADHEFHCTNTDPLNHKIHFRHEEGSSHLYTVLDVSYGKNWDDRNNKNIFFFNQSFKNQSSPNQTSYTLEFNLQVPEKNLNCRIQLLHSHLMQLGSESSTHLKINYNNQIPLVAELHWKLLTKGFQQKKWGAIFNMDTPWMYVYTSHKLSQLHRHTLQLTSELMASKWLSIRNLKMKGFYRCRNRDKEVRLLLYTPATTYLQVGVQSAVRKWPVEASVSLSSLWTLPLRGNISLEISKFIRALHITASYGKQNISFAGAVNSANKKSRQMTLNISSSKPRSPTTEVALKVSVEEIRRDRTMQQKTAVLQLRQPFQSFPQDLLLQNTFTADRHKGQYILETKAAINNRDILHTLILEYKPSNLLLCSALFHPFSSDRIPSNCTFCIAISSNQTHKDISGSFKVKNKERLTFSWVFQEKHLPLNYQVLKVKANFTQQLELHLPSSALMEGDVCWGIKDNDEFEYQTRGRLRAEQQECQLFVQINGTSGRVGLHSSLSHPFKSKIPKALGVKASADISVPGKMNSSVHMSVNGKDKVILDSLMSHSVLKGTRNVGLKLNFTQSILPTVTNLFANISANLSLDSILLCGSFSYGPGTLLAQIKGSLITSRSLRLSLSADLRHSVPSRSILPTNLDGALGQSNSFTEGVSVSSSALVEWTHDVDRLLVLAELHAGPEHLKIQLLRTRTDPVSPRWHFSFKLLQHIKALLQRRLMSSFQAEAHFQFAAQQLDTGLVLLMENEKTANILFKVEAKNKTIIWVVSLWQQIKLLQGLIPTSSQLNCSGDTTEKRLSTQCFGSVEGHHVEAQFSIQGSFPEIQSRARLSVAGLEVLTSGLNVSRTEGYLAALLLYSPSVFNGTKTKHKLGTVLTSQFKAPLKSVSIDVTSQDWRLLMTGDVGGWGFHAGIEEARFTLRHSVHGENSPSLQVEAWGKVTESQLRCSMVVNPELSSSLAFVIQGHRVPQSQELVIKVVNKLPKVLAYLPCQFNFRSQLNQTQSSTEALLEVSTGRRRLWALGELVAIGGGFRQTVEVKHSCPQLKPLPRTITFQTLYKTKDWNYHLQQAAVWGTHEFSLFGLYAAPPEFKLGNQTLEVHIRGLFLLTNLDVKMERSLHGRLDSVLLGWMRRGQLKQVRALRAWSHSEEKNETKVELQQPFSPALGQLSLQSLSCSSQREQHSTHQISLWWDGVVPLNVSLSLDKHWGANTSRGQACALMSAQKMSSVKGCVTLSQEGNSYSQNAELKWDERSVMQSATYQKDMQGVHSLQVHVDLDRVLLGLCPSQTSAVEVQTNLEDHLEHTLLLDWCPPQPVLSWSGSHRINLVDGRSYQSSFTINSSSVSGADVPLSTEEGNWSLRLEGGVLSQPLGSGLQIQVTLDHREKIWLNWTQEGECLQTSAGYTTGPGLSEDLTISMCLEAQRSLIINVKRQDDTSEPLGHLFLGAANRKLVLRMSGSLDSLRAAEERLYFGSSHICQKLREKIKTLQHLLAELKRQFRDSELLQDLSAGPLQISQHATVLLEQGSEGLLAAWHRSSLRLSLTDTIPRLVNLLQHFFLLGQQELKRPLATLASVYHDVKGQRLEEMWSEAVLTWINKLEDLLAVLRENHQPGAFSPAGVALIRTVLDVAGQHTYSWIENRLATALSGVRKQLASLYKVSPRECAVTVAVPIPHLASSKLSESGPIRILLEEWLLQPLQAFSSMRPTALLYRLKRKIMESPFIHQALLVANQFVVTFDGHVLELPGSCLLLLAQDVHLLHPSFTLLISADPESLLLMNMNNHTIHIHRNGQVKVDCSKSMIHSFYRDDGLTVMRGSNTIQVSNQNGASVSCDVGLEVCSFTLDGRLHGASTGLFGTNDNEAGNDFPLRNGSQAKSMEDFFHSWELRPKCSKAPTIPAKISSMLTSPVSCDSLFFSPSSPLSSCFKVVNPAPFLLVCESGSFEAPCRLASAFVHLCKRNYIPLEVPLQCMKT